MLRTIRRYDVGGAGVYDSLNRIWRPDVRPLYTAVSGNILSPSLLPLRVSVPPNVTISGTGHYPDYLPQGLYQTQRVGDLSGGVLEVAIPVGSSQGVQFTVRLHFAELNPTVQLGQRVMDIYFFLEVTLRVK